MLKRLFNVFPGFTGFIIFLSCLLFFGGFMTGLIICVEDFDLGIILGPSIMGGGLLLFIDYCIAGWFYCAASDKGYYDFVYLSMPFFLGVIGYLLVCALPNKNANSPTPAPVQSDELPDL